jgi:hypothetical protein
MVSDVHEAIVPTKATGARQGWARNEQSLIVSRVVLDGTTQSGQTPVAVSPRA